MLLNWYIIIHLLKPIAEIGSVTTSAINPCSEDAPFANNLTLRLGNFVLNSFSHF